MTNPQNRNTGNTARFQIGDRARNPKRPSLEALKQTLTEIAEATNHKVEFERILDGTEARFTHNQLNTENGLTVEQITQTVDEEVNWECNHNYYRKMKTFTQDQVKVFLDKWGIESSHLRSNHALLDDEEYAEVLSEHIQDKLHGKLIPKSLPMYSEEDKEILEYTEHVNNLLS